MTENPKISQGRDTNPSHTLTIDNEAATTGVGGPPALTNSIQESTWRYRIGEEIAHGGMGVIYRAIDTVLGREVAVKVLKEKFRAISGPALRFADEAHITAQLQHPAIPPVHDLGTFSDGRPFLAMKLIKGETLQDQLAGRTDPSHGRGRFIAVFEQICQAIAYAHDRRVIHRDLKPANVMVGSFGEVQVMDWGLAKVLGHQPAGTTVDPNDTAGGTEIRSTRDSDGSETQAGSVLGTPAFMPPEQAVGAIGKIDERSDVFGLGAILAVILTGKPPYSSSDTETTRVLAARGKVDECFVRLDACGADPELVALCKRCLAPEKENRPGDAGAVAGAVASLRAAADERARQAELERVKTELKAAEQRKRRRVQLLLVVAIGFLVFGVVAFGWWNEGEKARRQIEADGRNRDERERRERNAEAVTILLNQCEEALRVGDGTMAEVGLQAAEKRLDDGGADNLAGRLGRLKDDFELLQNLDAVDRFRWFLSRTTFQDRSPSLEIAASSEIQDNLDKPHPREQAVLAQYKAAFGKFGADPDAVSPNEAAARVAGSVVSDRLVSAFDRVLRIGRSARIRATLQAIDPDPYRDAVRDAVLAGDRTKVAGLAGQPAALEQPPGFAAALGENYASPVSRRRELLVATVQRRPGDLTLLMALGHTYPINQRKGADERMRWFQTAVGVAPKNPATHGLLGIAMHDLGDLKAAEFEYRESIRLDPNYAHSHINLGVLLERKNDLTGAENEYRIALFLYPQIAALHSNLGWLLSLKDDLIGAEAEMREALRIDPKLAIGHCNLGGLLVRKGDMNRAETESREAIRLDPNLAHAHLNLGNVLDSRNDFDKAESEYREAIRLNPELAYAHSWLGWVLDRQGNLIEAEAEYRKAIRIDPKLAYAHNNLGWVLERRGDRPGAEKKYREAHQLDPKLGLARNNLKRMLELKGDSSGIETLFREAIRLEPKNAEVHYQMALFMRRQENLAEAEYEYREAIRLNAKFDGPHNNLGYLLLFYKGDTAGAIREFKEALLINPKLSFAITNLARAERVAQLLPRLPDILAGRMAPKDPLEACEFAKLLAMPFQKQYPMSVRMYEQAFASNPRLLTDMEKDHRYTAASTANLAGLGEGVNALGPTERAVLRSKALAWLQADLAFRKKQASSPSGKERKTAEDNLAWWLQDPNLSSKRVAQLRSALPEDERAAWDALWAEVEATIRMAQKAAEVAPQPRPKADSERTIRHK